MVTPKNGAQSLIHYKWAWLDGVHVHGFHLIAPTVFFPLLFKYWGYLCNLMLYSSCTRNNQTFSITFWEQKYKAGLHFQKMLQNLNRGSASKQLLTSTERHSSLKGSSAGPNCCGAILLGGQWHKILTETLGKRGRSPWQLERFIIKKAKIKDTDARSHLSRFDLPFPLHGAHRRTSMKMNAHLAGLTKPKCRVKSH